MHKDRDAPLICIGRMGPGSTSQSCAETDKGKKNVYKSQRKLKNLLKNYISFTHRELKKKRDLIQR